MVSRLFPLGEQLLLGLEDFSNSMDRRLDKK
jgi:hypothetical protein